MEGGEGWSVVTRNIPSIHITNNLLFAASLLTVGRSSPFAPRPLQDKSRQNLHPTNPEAYRGTRAMGYEDLTTELREFVYNLCHCIDCKGERKFEGDDADARGMVCGENEGSVVVEGGETFGVWEDWAGTHPDPPPSPPDSTPRPIETEGIEVEMEGTSTLSKHGLVRKIVTTVNPEAIKPEHITRVDPEEWGEGDDACGGRMKIVVVVVCEGEYDLSTAPIFLPIATNLANTLRSLLQPFNPSTFQPSDVHVSVCVDLRFCRFSTPAYSILLGAHHLARYTDLDGKVASIITDFPKRDRTAIYNFEEARMQGDWGEQGGMWDVVKYYR